MHFVHIVRVHLYSPTMTGMRQTNMYPSTCGYYSACDVSHLPFILPPLFTAGRISPAVGGMAETGGGDGGQRERRGGDISSLAELKSCVNASFSLISPLKPRGHTRARAHTLHTKAFQNLPYYRLEKVLQPVRPLLLVIHSNYFPSVTLKLAPNPSLLIFSVCLLTRIYIVFYLCRSSSSSH